MYFLYVSLLIIISFVSLLGVYLSRYADLLQANPLEAGAVGDVVIFKIMKVILTFIIQYIKDNILFVLGVWLKASSCLCLYEILLREVYHL